ncbi:MAG TPA: ABC transporter permease [Chthoniobacterales bacterium]|nr:ABC transporter permease [Chthoniobacterales bacterium]
MALQPRLGRNLTEEDDRPGAAPIVMISDKLWQTHFGGSPDAVGQQVVLDGISREIIGVLPAELKFPRMAQVYVPLDEMRKNPSLLNRSNHQGFSVTGRLKPGVSLDKATADLNNIAEELERKYPESNTDRRVSAELLLESSVGDYRQSLHLLLGAVACVLLIACANVANLQLARAISRTKELAVRASLGASRWQLMRQVLVESTLLARRTAITSHRTHIQRPSASPFSPANFTWRWERIYSALRRRSSTRGRTASGPRG